MKKDSFLEPKLIGEHTKENAGKGVRKKAKLNAEDHPPKSLRKNLQRGEKSEPGK